MWPIFSRFPEQPVAFYFVSLRSKGLKKISRTDRLCNLCDDRVVGDEFHYILKCKALCIERQMYIQEIYINKPSIAVMHKLFKDVVTPYTHISEASRYILYTIILTIDGICTLS